MKKLLLFSLTLIFFLLVAVKRKKKEPDSIKGTTWSRSKTSTTKDYLCLQQAETDTKKINGIIMVKSLTI